VAQDELALGVDPAQLAIGSADTEFAWRRASALQDYLAARQQTRPVFRHDKIDEVVDCDDEFIRIDAEDPVCLG
jgi:hypothetical protein